MKTAVFLLLFPVAALSADRSISVSGQCLRKVAPDRGTVTLVAQFSDKSAMTASKRATDTYEKIRAAVQQLRLKDLEMQTSEYNVQELFDYVNNKRVSRGMQASLGLQVSTSEISRLGEIAALTNKLEINRVENLSTYLSGERAKTAREECLVEAIKNARDKAVKMAQAANAKVGDVQLIDENPQLREPGFPRAEMALDAASGGMLKTAQAPGIESKPELISVNVLVKFGLN